MKRKEPPTKKRKAQHEKFVELTRESGADESEDSFVTKIKAISSTKPKSGGKMGKAAEIERIKLQATFKNNLAVGIITGGAFLPFFVMLATNVRPESIGGQLALFVIFAALSVGYLLRSSADKDIRRIPD